MFVLMTVYEIALRIECVLCTFKNSTSKVAFKLHILQEPLQPSGFSLTKLPTGLTTTLGSKTFTMLNTIKLIHVSITFQNNYKSLRSEFPTSFIYLKAPRIAVITK